MTKIRLTIAVLVTSFTLVSLSSLAADDAIARSEALALFEQRLMPIFRSPQPSSCIQCHLASVDLKNYILPSPEKSFVSLRVQGLIDRNSPEQSKMLTLIQMGQQD